MESQDGIDVRPMRLKVLYTFDSENKTNCLARWPHVLDIQTAYLDENTPIGVIELKTCIQAIVSASPELVAQLGKDYTVYAYDYSEYETPLVGQGMLSWVLSSSSPNEAQSKTMITGRVCKNTLGIFSKGAAQETLEVKLRLVPVPTVMQSEYLDSIQKYRDLSNVIPGDFDAQSWTNFVRQNPALLESSRTQSHAGSPMHHSGIERFHQLLSEGSTPREFSNFQPNESVRSVSPSHSYAPSRVSTPGGSRTPAYHQSYSKHNNPHSDIIRPSSSASMRENDFQSQVSYHQRRGSMQSGYGSGEEESTDPQPRKRAKVYQASWPGKSAMNIERQPSSLRVAASTAASVRIHRPTPVNPAIAAEQSYEEPVRPPTPMSRPSDFTRRSRPTGSLLRESSIASIASCPATYNSPYCQSDDMPGTDQTGPSPEDTRYQGLFEPSFSMPSSPPVFDGRLLNRSSPVLPPIALDTDSGFMSTGLDDLLDDETTTPQDDRRRAESHEITQEKRPVRPTVQASSPVSTIGPHKGTSNDPLPVDEITTDQPMTQAPPAQSRPATSGSRPSSSAGPQRLAPKPLLPGPIAPHNQCHPLMRAIPASDPIVPSRPVDVKFMPLETTKTNANVNTKAKRTKQAINMQTRLEQAIAKGEVPPYCENCGSIETPSWRRAWSKEVEGNDKVAEEMMQRPFMLFWDVLDRNSEGEVQKFLIYKKENEDHWKQMTFCNPCGLWLHKFKEMRPEHKWSKQPAAKKRKRPARASNGKAPNSCPATRTRSKAAPHKPAASSPAATEASSVPAEGETPQMDDDEGTSPNKRSRANSTEPQHPTEESAPNWNKQDAREAMRRAIRSSPARRTHPRPTSSADSTTSTPKPLRRSLFQNAQNEGPLKELDASMVNSCSPRRSPRIASTKDDKGAQKENHVPTLADDLDTLFESPSIDFDQTGSPTPRRRNARANTSVEKRLALPMNSPSANRRKDLSSAMTPTRLSAERLQRIQASQGSPRQQKSPNKQQPFAPLTTDENLHSEAFESLDGMILDIFDDADQPNHFFLQNAKFDGDNWADWLPEDYVSPTGSSDGPAEDLINSLFSDSEVNKDNLNSEFLPFNFDESVVPDSGFFSSDALHTDPIRPAPKAQSAGQNPDAQQANPSA